MEPAGAALATDVEALVRLLTHTEELIGVLLLARHHLVGLAGNAPPAVELLRVVLGEADARRMVPVIAPVALNVGVRIVRVDFATDAVHLDVMVALPVGGAEEAARATELPARGDGAWEVVGELARRDEAADGRALLAATAHAVRTFLVELREHLSLGLRPLDAAGRRLCRRLEGLRRDRGRASRVVATAW